MRGYLLDTSVWIEYFRHHAPYFEVVHQLLETHQAYCNEIILAELLQGARSEREVEGIEALRRYYLLPLSTEMWVKTGKIAHALRSKGVTKGLLDLAIGITAITYEIGLWTINIEDFQPLLSYGLQFVHPVLTS